MSFNDPNLQELQPMTASPPPPPRPPGRLPPSPPPAFHGTATPPDAFTRPYVDLMSPDWLTRAALAIAADLRERAGVGPQLELLDVAMRHQLVTMHANIIREVWRETFARTEPGGERSYPSDYATPRLRALDTSAEDLVEAHRTLGRCETALAMIEHAAKANASRQPDASLAYIEGLAAGARNALHMIHGPHGDAREDAPT